LSNGESHSLSADNFKRIEHAAHAEVVGHATVHQMVERPMD
jgi:hypothetical protein